jgi:Na+/H+ antiporter NhaC
MPAATPASESAATAPSAAATQSQPVAVQRLPEDYYGAWVLAPPLVAIVFAVLLRQVIPALSIGILVAAFMLVPMQPTAPGGLFGGAIVGLRLAVESYGLGALASLDEHADLDYSHLKIIVFTFMIGGMVGVIGANGGTRSVVNRVARWASTRERGQIATWFAGLIVFFDDYANAMIVGPSLRPMTDRLGISRAKLA